MCKPSPLMSLSDHAVTLSLLTHPRTHSRTNAHTNAPPPPHHNDKYLEVVGAKPPCSGDAIKTAAGTKPVSTFFSSKLKRPCDKNRAGVITDCILDWIVDSIRPLSIVSDNGFVHLMQVCEPSYLIRAIKNLPDKLAR